MSERMFETISDILEQSQHVEHLLFGFQGNTQDFNRDIDILLIEDEPTTRKLINMIFKKFDYSFQEISSGFEGLKYLDSIGYHVTRC
ncbi:MAG: hypothetical protein ACFFAS_12885 [Promethearchaeota archaeon]